jgi:hypothetical protein
MAEAVKGFDPDAKDYIAVRHAGVAAKLGRTAPATSRAPWW